MVFINFFIFNDKKYFYVHALSPDVSEKIIRNIINNITK